MQQNSKIECKPALFLDRDGTLIEDNGYLSEISQVHFYNETIPALELLKNDFIFFIISNQSGIGKGITTEKEVERVNLHILTFLKSKSIEITEVYVCPHVTEDNCNCKKPSPHFIQLATKKYNLDLKNSFIIGDHPSDVECGINAGINSIYVLTGHGKKHLNETNKNMLLFENILDAAKYIINNKK